MYLKRKFDFQKSTTALILTSNVKEKFKSHPPTQHPLTGHSLLDLNAFDNKINYIWLKYFLFRIDIVLLRLKIIFQALKLK